MTKAVSAQGTKVGVRYPISENTYKTFWFQEVKSTPAIGETPATIDVTHLGSSVKEYIMDIPDQSSSTLDFVMNAQPYVEASSDDDVNEVSNLGLVNMLSKTATYTFVILYPQDKIGFEILAQWTWSMGAGAVSSAMEINLSLVPKSAPTVVYMTNTTCTVTYNANGGTGTVTDSNTYHIGDEVTVKPGTSLTLENNVFAGWNTNADGTGVAYDESDTFTIIENTVLYAQWTSTVE